MMRSTGCCVQMNTLFVRSIENITKEEDRNCIGLTGVLWGHWWLLFVVVTTTNIFWKMPDRAWCGIWAFQIWMSVIVGIGMTTWIISGGVRDAQRLFRDLRAVKRDEHDDGTVESRLGESSINKE